jgi:tRNA-binding protein
MTPAALKPSITVDLLNQIDIRVGTIRGVTEVANSDKLVQLRVSFGDHERTIVAGLKQERANPREIEGKQALFVVNLEPRKMRGVASEGMLFDIGYADGVCPCAGGARVAGTGWHTGRVNSLIVDRKFRTKLVTAERARRDGRRLCGPAVKSFV